MKLLLDTHVVLWWYENPKKLSAESVRIIEDSSNELFLSSVVIWEILIKSGLKKLSFPDRLLDKAIGDLTELPVKIEHALCLKALDKKHNDPFDLLLIAQAKAENLHFATRDSQILKYDLPFIIA